MKKIKSATTLFVLLLCCLLIGGSFEGLVLCVGEDSSIALEVQGKNHEDLSPLDHCSGIIKDDSDRCVDILLSTGLSKNTSSKNDERIYDGVSRAVANHRSFSPNFKYLSASRSNLLLPPPDNSLEFLRTIILLA